MAARAAAVGSAAAVCMAAAHVVCGSGGGSGGCGGSTGSSGASCSYRMPRMVLGYAATTVIALQHRHVAVACVVVWAWHVCVEGGGG